MIRNAFRWLIGYCLGWWFVFSGKLRRRVNYYDTPGTLLSFAGHNPSRRTFEYIIRKLLSLGFRFITCDEAMELQKKDCLEKRLAWLSFDDGWLNFSENVLPVLEKYNIPVTLFIAPCETDRGFVWINGLLDSGYNKINPGIFSMSFEERERIVKENVTFANRTLMSREQIIALSKHPLVTVENHTATHLSCSHRPIADVLADVMKSSKMIKSWIGRDCRLVCYPFGHCNTETDAALRGIGLVPIKLDAGEGSVVNFGETRTLFRDKGPNVENICRIFNAWMKVRVPNKN